MMFRPNLTLPCADVRTIPGLPLTAGRVLAGAAVVGAAALLTWAAAGLRVPLQPVPITMQTLVVLLTGALIGPVRGSTSQMLYLGMGAAGVPLFAGAASGMATFAGPTAGYLVGFVVAPLIVGRWVGTGADYLRTLIVFSAGALAILALGVLHLAIFYTGDLATAVRVGLLPFVPGDIIKVFAAASIYCGYRRL